MMQNQTKYLLIYLGVLAILISSVVNLAQAQNSEPSDENYSQNELTAGQLEQILAPIALYPDTLLSHILVASTYPLEVVQAARWRQHNKNLSEQQVLDAAEEKDWDPSIKALTPFTDLLQTLSDDLDWLQSLGNAFLVEEERVLASVQILRKKAYEQGNLSDNQFIDVEQDSNQIIIQSVEKEVIYIPYYDTQTVYGTWSWRHNPPHFWHHPSHYILSAGIHWSTRFFIRPSFYFSGFHWSNRHLVTNYAYRAHRDNKHWSHSHLRRQQVRVTEYPRWTHNPSHRRGVDYKRHSKSVIKNSERTNGVIFTKHSSHQKKQHKSNKQRVLNIHDYPNIKPSNSHQIKRKLKAHRPLKSVPSSKGSRIDRGSPHQLKSLKASPKIQAKKWQKNTHFNPQHNSPKQGRVTPNYKKSTLQNRKTKHSKHSNSHSKSRATSKHRSNQTRSGRPSAERNKREKR